MHDSLRPAGISNCGAISEYARRERLAQHRFREQGQFGFDFVKFQVARDVGDRDAQELLMAKGADRIEPRLEVRRCVHQTRQLAIHLVAVAASLNEIGTHQRVEHIGMANEQRREVAAGGE